MVNQNTVKAILLREKIKTKVLWSGDSSQWWELAHALVLGKENKLAQYKVFRMTRLLILFTISKISYSSHR